MKEQVSGDNQDIYTDELASEVTRISQVELERLRRLDNNLQSQIKDLETWLAEEESQVTRYEIEETIILLKGLYDDRKNH